MSHGSSSKEGRFGLDKPEDLSTLALQILIDLQAWTDTHPGLMKNRKRKKNTTPLRVVGAFQKPVIRNAGFLLLLPPHLCYTPSIHTLWPKAIICRELSNHHDHTLNDVFGYIHELLLPTTSTEVRVLIPDKDFKWPSCLQRWLLYVLSWVRERVHTLLDLP